MTTPGARWPLAIMVSGALLGGLAAAGGPSALRLILGLWFMLVCTGMAYVPLLSIKDPAVEIAVGVAASLALDTVVVATMASFGDLSASVGLLALAGLCLVGCGLQIERLERFP